MNLDLVRRAIEERGWSNVARSSGVDRVTLHRCFGNRRARYKPSLRTLEATLSVLGLEITITEKRSC